MPSTKTDDTVTNGLTVAGMNLPTGGGAVRGIGDTFQPDSFAGTGSYSIPFPVTKARGFEPSVVLNYGSGSGNGAFGFGFSPDLPSIRRRTDKGIPRYDDRDLFMLSDGTELVKQLPGDNAGALTVDNYEVTVYLPRLQSGFDRIEYWLEKTTGLAHWKVISSESVIRYYGKSANSCISNPQDPKQIFEWLLDESTDPKGNKIQYAYLQDVTETSNRYIEKIFYGNYTDGTEQFAFEVRFDYNRPVSRPDPFSSFRSGFEIRTNLLCRKIRLYHHFQNELGGEFLVKTLDLQYSFETQPPGPCLYSMLTKVVLVGHDKDKNGSIIDQPLPPLLLQYSDLSIEPAPAFQELKVTENTLPDYLNDSGLLPVDLNGDGLPGMLYNGTGYPLYSEPTGEGHYLFPRALQDFPLNGTTGSIEDIDGNGQFELVVESEGLTGYYPNKENGRWDSYRPLPNCPNTISDPYLESADITGDGLNDLLLAKKGQLLIYFSRGEEGYDPLSIVQTAADFPVLKQDDTKVLVCFADIFGDGLPHRLRVQNGSVEVWPCLGYGRYGERRFLQNAPVFGEDFDAGRIYLADIDGSGTVDLVYAYTDRVLIYRNSCGNSFEPPLEIRLPEIFTAVDEILFTDITGSGTSSLVFSKMAPAVKHYYYTFHSKGSQTGGVSAKPYLLTGIDNGLGSVTEIHYCSSTYFSLKDRAAGRPWVTKLRFPVQVVDRIGVHDRLSGSRLDRLFSYHDGYFDPVEKVFSGFGFVESWDTEHFEKWQASTDPDFPVERLNKDLYVPPVYTKTWYITGAYERAKAISEQYEKEYFHGDPLAYSMPHSFMDPSIGTQGPGVLREAYFALKGQLLRSEVYGEDGSDKSSNPYTVRESNFRVDMLQPKGDQPYAVFLVSPREDILYQYERDPADPRVQQNFTIEIDLSCGKSIKTCIAYLNRRGDPGPLKATGQYNYYLNAEQGNQFYYRGLVEQVKECEITGLNTGTTLYISFEQMKEVSEALDHPLKYDSGISGGTVEARLYNWQRFKYNETVKGSGNVSFPVLVHHIEKAVFTPSLISTVFGPLITEDTIQSYGGYFFDSQNGYWWNPGISAIYGGAKTYFLVVENVNDHVPTTSPLYSRTTVNYHAPYNFSIEASTEWLDVAQNITNITRGEVDYRTMQYRQIVDINGTVAQAIFNPLGLVIADTLFGLENNLPTGGMLLHDYEGKKAQYIPKDAGSFGEVLEQPMDFLQGACSFYYYNLLAWPAFSQPLSAIELKRNSYYQQQGMLDDLGPASTEVPQITIIYFDGLGRALESKIKTDPGEAITWSTDGKLLIDKDQKPVRLWTESRWVVSGRTVYDNKNNPCEQYLPYFSNTPDYENQQELADKNGSVPPSITHYDALSRAIRIDTPKGFFSMVVFSPWEVKNYDENDTILESWYYENCYNTLPLEEKEALKRSFHCYYTPSIRILDSMGHTVRSIVNNLGAVVADDFLTITGDNKVLAEALFNDLVNKGYLETFVKKPVGTWVTSKFQPYTKGFVLQLDPAFQPYAGEVTGLLKQNGLVTKTEYDIQGRVLSTVDPRLYYKNQTENASYENFGYTYPMGSEDPIFINSADGGPGKFLNNVFGNQFWSLSARNYCQLIGYDCLQRKAYLKVKKIKTDEPITSYDDFNLVEIFLYGEYAVNLQGYNLRGNPYKVNDLSGILTYPSYSIQGAVLKNERRMVADYKQAVNWNDPPVLEPENKIHTQEYSYNALNQQLTNTTPDGSLISNSYNRTGLVSAISISYEENGKTVVAPVISNIDYNANQQRTSLIYGNGLHVKYDYEDTTSRLLNQRTTRADGLIILTLQDIRYIYDAIGNTSYAKDDAVKTVFNNNQKVEAAAVYNYDALYRLIKAEGRQHIGINANTFKNNASEGSFKQSIFGPDFSPNSADALENYKEAYSYDDAGNLIQRRHTASSGSFTIKTPVREDSNHLERIDPYSTQPIQYDASGNQVDLTINNTIALKFNCCELLVSAPVIQRDGTDDTDYYLYNYLDLRTRKVSVVMAQGGLTTLIQENTYVENFEERKTSTVVGSGPPVLSGHTQTVRVMDGTYCVAILHNRIVDNNPADLGRRLLYQLTNTTGSVSLQTDATAQLASYEEYFPYGGTSIIAGKSQREVSEKYYRYCGKECDDSTGLYYFGARYYLSWACRWLSADPSGPVDGLNLYCYAGNNPLTFWDPDGRSKKKAAAPLPAPAPPKKASKRTYEEMDEPTQEIGEELVPIVLAETDAYDPMVADPTDHKGGVYQAAKARHFTKAQFGQFYRKLFDAQDELVSTSSVRELLHGVLGAMPAHISALHEQNFREIFDDISRVRFPTAWSGFARSAGFGPDRMQHPTSPGTGIWRDTINKGSGNPHTHLDMERRDYILTALEDEIASITSGEEFVRKILSEAIIYTLNNFTAPAAAQDQYPLATVTQVERVAQTDKREELKRLAIKLGAKQEKGNNKDKDRAWGNRQLKRTVSQSRLF